MRKRIVAGNWKMNCSVDETERLIKSLRNLLPAERHVETIICPPYTALAKAVETAHGSGLIVGAQDLSPHESGAYTGEVSARMLLTLGVTHVIIGHSERRQYHAESDSLVQKKISRALTSGLVPIVCVGETLAEREAGRTGEVVLTQLDAATAVVTGDAIGKVIVAYEPVWAIGTGKTASPEQAQEVHRMIRARMSEMHGAGGSDIPLLYGGSAKKENAAGLFACPDIDGALVGGASLNAEEFAAIVAARL